ncbi:MAG TPA: ROK family protein [Verrucomicrobiae bacterium]
MQHTCLGIEIGGTKLQIVVGDDSATIIERRRFPVDREQGGAGIRRQIESAMADMIPAWQPAAIAVGFGGPVDWRTGRIAKSHQIEGWSEFELGPWLSALTQRPVRVENDANLAALGEALCGAGRGFNPVFYVTLGSGVGGGLVIDGNVYHGAKPGEAEIGHVRLDRQGTVLEHRCSGWAVDEKIRQLKTQAPDSLLWRLVCEDRIPRRESSRVEPQPPPLTRPSVTLSPTGGEGWGEAVRFMESGGEAKHLAAALREQDPAARQILNETTEDLAFGLSHVVHLFHPEVIVIGGGLSLVGEPLRAAVEQALRGFVMEVFAPGPRVTLAGLGEDAVPTGALHLARTIARWPK